MHYQAKVRNEYIKIRKTKFNL